jgi:hypothetical protein
MFSKMSREKRSKALSQALVLYAKVFTDVWVWVCVLSVFFKSSVTTLLKEKLLSSVKTEQMTSDYDAN